MEVFMAQPPVLRYSSVSLLANPNVDMKRRLLFGYDLHLQKTFGLRR
jgi:hypothetical protein